MTEIQKNIAVANLVIDELHKDKVNTVNRDRQKNEIWVKHTFIDRYPEDVIAELSVSDIEQPGLKNASLDMLFC